MRWLASGAIAIWLIGLSIGASGAPVRLSVPDGEIAYERTDPRLVVPPPNVTKSREPSGVTAAPTTGRPTRTMPPSIGVNVPSEPMR